MRVMVTGAAGFIGQHVCKLLGAEGHEVISLDNSAVVYLNPNLTWADITQPLDPILDLDAVIHLAAMANPRECDANPGKAFDTNVNGTHQVLKMALESGARKVVFSSTAHVYGISPRYYPTDEQHPLWLQNNYTLSKILGETMCDLYHDNHGLSYTTLRLFNAYGPGQQAGYFIPDMIAKAKSGCIELQQGGNTTKDWVYIDDVARAFVSALETSFVGPINIGTGVETPLWSIASQIAAAHDAQLFNLDPGSGATRMQCDPARAFNQLGWMAETTLKEGLGAILATETVSAKP